MNESDLNSAFANSDPFKVIIELASLIADDSGDPDQEIDIRSFPLVVNTPNYLLIFDGQVSNGGFHQFFTNYSGEFAPEILEVLKAINASKTAKLLEKALTVFPDRRPPRDHSERWDQVVASGEEGWKMLLQLDEQYYSGEEDIFALAVEFIKKRKIELLSYNRSNG